MLELFQESIKGFNLPFTILLGAIILYWVIALLGLVDVDAGGDFDFDVEVGSDGEGAGEDGSAGFWNSVMRVFGFSDAPIMFVISVFVVMIWMLNIVVNMCFNHTDSLTHASMMLLPVLIGGFVLTRLLIRPLRPVMKLLRSNEAAAPIIGEQGEVISATLSEEFGRVKIDFEGRALILNAVVSDAGVELKKGSAVLVVSKQDESDNYIVRPL